MNTGNDEEPQVRLKLPTYPPIIFGIPFGVGAAVHFLLWEQAILPGTFALVLGLVLLIDGVLVASWTVFEMMRRGEHPEPHKPTNRIVDTGPFRISRNPIYLGFVLIGLGISFALNSVAQLVGSAGGAVAIHFLVIKREEVYLQSLFGEVYAAYRSTVRRWI